jgi:hypothetical protein
MTTFRVEAPGYRPYTFGAAELIVHCIEEKVMLADGTGAVEDARRYAQETAETLGRLVERLLDEGRLDAPDVIYIAGSDHKVREEWT